MSCPVVRLCKGACIFLNDEIFRQSCANEFNFKMGTMMVATTQIQLLVHSAVLIIPSYVKNEAGSMG